MHLQFSFHLFAFEVVISIGVKAEMSEEPSEGVCIPISANPIFHTTGEIFIVDHNTWKMMYINNY